MRRRIRDLQQKFEQEQPVLSLSEEKIEIEDIRGTGLYGRICD